MSAPERIWAVDSITHGWGDGHCTDSPVQSARLMSMVTEYVRADLAPQWQDIATAPQDTTILVCQSQNNIIATARGTNENGNWRTGVGPMAYIDGVTHWMPLPTPPEPST